MVTTRAAAMEARVEALEQKLEAQDRVLESISQQLSQLLNARREESPTGSDNGRRSQEWGSTRHGGEASHNPPRLDLGRKIELPVFCGEDAYGWLTHVERYFCIQGVDDDDKLEVVLVALEGEALVWFQWWEDQVPCPTWREFEEDLVKRFQPGVARNPMEPILSVRQTGSVHQYRKEFELVAGARRDLNAEVVMGIFLHGLKEEIRAELKVNQFRSLNALMDRALELEERNVA